MIKKAVFIILICLFLFSCASTNTDEYGVPRNAVRVWPYEFIGSHIVSIVLELVVHIDPELDRDTVNELLYEASEDPDTISYYIPTSNSDMTNLSREAAILSGTVALAEFSIRNATLTVKRAARSGAAVDAVENVEGEEGLTEEEIEILKSRKSEFSDEERLDLKKSYLYLAVSSAAMTNTLNTIGNLISQVAEFIASPKKLVSNPLEIFSTINQLKQINDVLLSLQKNVPNVIKNTSALFEVLKVVLDTSEDEISETKEF